MKTRGSDCKDQHIPAMFGGSHENSWQRGSGNLHFVCSLRFTPRSDVQGTKAVIERAGVEVSWADSCRRPRRGHSPRGLSRTATQRAGSRAGFSVHGSISKASATFLLRHSDGFGRGKLSLSVGDGVGSAVPSAIDGQVWASASTLQSRLSRRVTGNSLLSVVCSLPLPTTKETL